MKILRGGSAETTSNRWVKFDVELDEADIQRILIEHDMAGHQLSVRDAFSLLEAEAETLVTVKMESLGVRADVSAQEQALRTSKIITRLRDNFYGGIGDNEI